LKSLTSGSEEAYEANSPKLRRARKQIKARHCTKPPLTVQCFLKLSSLGTCCKVTHDPLHTAVPHVRNCRHIAWLYPAPFLTKDRIFEKHVDCQTTMNMNTV